MTVSVGVSQPSRSGAAGWQSAKPAAPTEAQAAPSQIARSAWRVSQRWPQPPQSASVVIGVSQPVLPMVQWAKPGTHANTQAPATHAGASLRALHACWQAPQLVAS